MKELKDNITDIPNYPLDFFKSKKISCGKLENTILKQIKEIVSNFSIDGKNITIDTSGDNSVGIRTNSYINLSRFGELFKLNYSFYSSVVTLYDALIEELINSGAEYNG